MFIDHGTFYLQCREDESLFIENRPYSVCYRFYAVLQGKITYMDGLNNVHMEAGDIFILPPAQEQVLAARPVGPCRQLVLYLSEEQVKQLSFAKEEIKCFVEQFKENSHLLLHGNQKSAGRLEGIIKALDHECADSSCEDQSMIEFSLCQWIMVINRLGLPLSNKRSGMIGAVLDYLDGSFTENISQNELADRFHVSKFHLLREFKKHSGKTIHEYVVEKRMEFVKGRLEEGRSIMETSSLAGFSDYSLFYKAFLKYMGEAPKQYQSRMMMEEELQL